MITQKDVRSISDRKIGWVEGESAGSDQPKRRTALHQKITKILITRLKKYAPHLFRELNDNHKL
jgi:hypothetical protein